MMDKYIIDCCADSVEKWNALRYEKVYNHELSLKLLTEEYKEFMDAWRNDDLLKMLDGIGDYYFVLLGVRWKNPEDYLNVFDKRAAMYALLNKKLHLNQKSLAQVIVSSILAVSLSNDTKKVEKVSSDIKANIDKGSRYVEPDALLQIIIDNLEGGWNPGFTFKNVLRAFLVRKNYANTVAYNNVKNLLYSMEGKIEANYKLKSSKLDFTLMPPKQVETIVKVFDVGKHKYGAYGWKEQKPEVFLRATYRHFNSILQGEIMDPETGLPHAAHICTNMMIFQQLMEDKNE